MSTPVINRLLLIIFIQCCFSSITSAQIGYDTTKDIAGFKNKMKLSSKSTKTIVCDFTQEKKVSILTKKVISKGHFWFKMPGNIRWEYVQPYSYLIIYTNQNIYVKGNDSIKKYDTQSSNSAFKELGAMMFNFLKGNIAACETDYIITIMENELFYYLKLVPKSAKIMEFLSQIDLYFDKKDLTISKIKMLEKDGDYSLLEFNNKKLNATISDTIFKPNKILK